MLGDSLRMAAGGLDEGVYQTQIKQDELAQKTRQAQLVAHGEKRDALKKQYDLARESGALTEENYRKAVAAIGAEPTIGLGLNQAAKESLQREADRAAGLVEKQKELGDLSELRKIAVESATPKGFREVPMTPEEEAMASSTPTPITSTSTVTNTSGKQVALPGATYDEMQTQKMLGYAGKPELQKYLEGRTITEQQKESMAATQVQRDILNAIAHSKIADAEMARKAKEGEPPTEDEISSLGGTIAAGVPISQAIKGMGGNATKLAEIGRKDAIKQIMDTTGMNPAQAGKELALRMVDYKSLASSDRQLNVMERATEQAIKQLDFNVDKTSEIMKEIPSSDLSPILNAIVRGEEKWTGDPKYSSLFFYLSGSAIEAARIRSGGVASIAQLHQGAMEEAKQWSSINMTPASWYEIAKAMKAEGRARLDTYRSTRLGQRSEYGNTTSASTKPLLNTSPSGAPAGGANTVTDPNGKVHTFPNAQSAAAFKKAIGQ